MSDYLDRVKAEKQALDEKLSKLKLFLADGQPEHVSDEQWYLLFSQKQLMVTYSQTLAIRIALTEAGK